MLMLCVLYIGCQQYFLHLLVLAWFLDSLCLDIGSLVGDLKLLSFYMELMTDLVIYHSDIFIQVYFDSEF